MANMSYCRWENTRADHVNDPLSGSEARARASLLELAADMREDVGVTIDRRELDEALSNVPGGE